MLTGGPERPVGGLSVRAPQGTELRPAGRDDLADILHLLSERDGVAPPGLTPDEATRRWEDFVSSVDAAPFVASMDGQLVGVMILAFRRRLNFATWEGWVPELVVARDHRRRGIGRALLRAAIEEWRLRGAHRLSVELATGEEPAAALAGGLGFARSFVRFLQEPIATQGAFAQAGVTIRPLVDDDFEAATRLVAEMGSHRSPVPERMAAVERSFREIVRQPNAASLLAIRDGRGIGIATVEIRETLRSAGSEAWIPELVVTEPERGLGIGRALLEAALAASQSRGATRAVLESGPQRAAAQELYRSVGFREAGSVSTLLRDR